MQFSTKHVFQSGFELGTGIQRGRDLEIHLKINDHFVIDYLRMTIVKEVQQTVRSTKDNSNFRNFQSNSSKLFSIFLQYR